MKEQLPTMKAYAIQTLCILHASCDVERSFSTRKNVHSEKQYSMQHGLPAQSMCLIWLQRCCECTVKTELRMEAVSVMLSTACNALGRHENLVLRRFSPFFTVFHGFNRFSQPQ